jgi:hypothetical protein
MVPGRRHGHDPVRRGPRPGTVGCPTASSVFNPAHRDEEDDREKAEPRLRYDDEEKDNHD